MALPADSLSSSAVAGTFLAPDDLARNLLEDRERGGVALSDPSQGLLVQHWRIFKVGDDVRVEGLTTLAVTTLFTEAGITELSLAFDQNMRPTVAYVAAGAAKLYWYDTLAGNQVFTVLAPDVISPMVCMDDKRPSQTSANDVLLFYIRGNKLRYRQQRDRYTIERDLADLAVGTNRIKRLGMNNALRLQIETGIDAVAPPPPGTGPFYGTAYVDLIEDRVYVTEDEDIIPFFDIGLRTGLWRSKKIALHEHPNIGWLRVNGPMAVTFTVRIYADGVLWHTATVAAREPMRLPSKRLHRHWEIEVEGAGRVGNVVLAHAAEELR